MKRSVFLQTLGISSLFTMDMNLHELRNFADQLPSTDPMPVLFLGHGSPMNALEDNEFTRAFKEVAKNIQKPAAILCVSAHWFTRGTFVTAMQMPRTIHDFGGFPRELYEVQYPAPGSPGLAQTTKELVKSTTVQLDETWGLDHGAWSVIKHLYPDASVPVIQFSIDYTRNAEWHFNLAKELALLRKKGILIIGSGNIIHNLGMVDFQNFYRDNYGYDWAIEARALFNKHLLSGDTKPLLQYQSLGKPALLSIPSPDHYLPLIYTLGLKEEKDAISLFNDKLVAGSLSMTSVKIG
ncbi:MAG: 4,5-DOPA dioxygenase extradiol [Chitinophagaceae bacterium]|nr:4,5-DOPA dioxygenase extradiol [Chitinophagaceae bacterium]